MENRGGKSGEIRGNPGAGEGNEDRQGGARNVLCK